MRESGMSPGEFHNMEGEHRVFVDHKLGTAPKLETEESLFEDVEEIENSDIRQAIKNLSLPARQELDQRLNKHDVAWTFVNACEPEIQSQILELLLKLDATAEEQKAAAYDQLLRLMQS